MSVSRRDFLGTSLASAGLGATIGMPRIVSAAKTDGQYRTALIGAGGWGTNSLREAIASKACEFVGLCDVDDAPVRVTALA